MIKFFLLCMGVSLISHSKQIRFESLNLSSKRLERTTAVIAEICCKNEIHSGQQKKSDLIHILIQLDKGESLKIYNSVEMKDIVYTCTGTTKCKTVPTFDTNGLIHPLNLYARVYCGEKDVREDLDKANEPFIPIIMEKGKPDISIDQNTFTILNSCNSNITIVEKEEAQKKGDEKKKRVKKAEIPSDSDFNFRQDYVAGPNEDNPT